MGAGRVARRNIWGARWRVREVWPHSERMSAVGLLLLTAGPLGGHWSLVTVWSFPRRLGVTKSLHVAINGHCLTWFGVCNNNFRWHRFRDFFKLKWDSLQADRMALSLLPGGPPGGP